MEELLREYEPAKFQSIKKNILDYLSKDNETLMQLIDKNVDGPSARSKEFIRNLIKQISGTGLS